MGNLVDIKAGAIRGFGLLTGSGARKRLWRKAAKERGPIPRLKILGPNLAGFNPRVWAPVRTPELTGKAALWKERPFLREKVSPGGHTGEKIRWVTEREGEITFSAGGTTRLYHAGDKRVLEKPPVCDLRRRKIEKSAPGWEKNPLIYNFPGVRTPPAEGEHTRK